MANDKHERTTVMYFFRAILVSLTLSWLPGSAVADDQKPLKAWAEGNFRYGQERSILMTEFWVPFMQDKRSVLYGDMRLMGDDEDNQEGNIGIGYRQITKAPVLGDGVVGIHGWIDHRITARNSRFNQATIGGEWLGETLDILVNGYVPLSSGETHIIRSANPQGTSLVGTGIVVDTDGVLLEEPQYGMDVELGIEVGQSIPFIKNNTDSVRLYGGGYYFNSDKTESLVGGRVRLSADITQDIQIGMRFQKDDERGSQGFLEASLRFPFGHKQSYRNEGLFARLDDSPERDIDIVTGDVVTTPAGSGVAVINQVTGLAQEVLHVDNTAPGAGDGSAETPFNTLAAAEAAATAQTIIYLKRGDGTTTGQADGILLDKTGQQLIGSGTNFLYDDGRFTTANGVNPSSTLIASAGPAPVITNGAGSGVDITADDVTVAGLTVDGASGEGIYALNNSGTTWNKVRVHDVTAQNNAAEGLQLQSTGASSIIDAIGVNRIVTQNNGGDGFRFVIDGVNTAINKIDAGNIVTMGNTGFGIFIANFGDGQINSTILKDITTIGNGIDGIGVGALSGGQISNTILENIIATGNANNGVRILSTNVGSSINSITMNNMTVTNNTREGVNIIGRNDSDLDSVTLQNSIITGNGREGILIDDDTTGGV